ncbi:Crp/Fnr family transcriptional regulator [Paenibacillus sp. GCM10023252]|uniref:Crp/Fnr family transcriptional regulator n=1 Tax=Paenibacillus sp. GCM10023252 TaxID=3252649 RepID=UPI003607D3E6
MVDKWDSIYAELLYLAPVPHEEWLVFQALCRPITLRKGEYYMKQGEIADRMGFCLRGLFRVHASTRDGKQLTQGFLGAGGFAASYSSMLQVAPSLQTIEALSDSTVVSITYKDFQSLYDRNVCWERLGRRLAEGLLVRKELRERELLLPPDQRVQLFDSKYGHLASQIPAEQVASCLGMSSASLARIREKQAGAAEMVLG